MARGMYDMTRHDDATATVTAMKGRENPPTISLFLFRFLFRFLFFLDAIQHRSAC